MNYFIYDLYIIYKIFLEMSHNKVIFIKIYVLETLR